MVAHFLNQLRSLQVSNEKFVVKENFHHPIGHNGMNSLEDSILPYKLNENF